MQLIPNEYNEQVRLIDEAILDLIQQRKKATEGRRFAPSTEQLQRWANRYGMDQPHLAWIVHTLNTGSRWTTMEPQNGELRNVVPILLKAKLDHCEYRLTHAMQHEQVSLITLEIQLEDVEDMRVNIHPRLMLDIVGEQVYTVSRDHSRSSGNQATVLFRVMPPLPDDFEGRIQFALIPFGPPEEAFSPRTLELTERVDF